MRTLATLVALLLTAPALGQEANEVGYVQEDVTAKRFPDAEVDGPELVSGTRVTVLVREEARLRVRAGTSYGWVPVKAIGPESPSEAAPPMFDPKALEALLQQAGAEGGAIPLPPPE